MRMKIRRTVRRGSLEVEGDRESRDRLEVEDSTTSNPSSPTIPTWRLIMSMSELATVAFTGKPEDHRLPVYQPNTCPVPTASHNTRLESQCLVSAQHYIMSFVSDTPLTRDCSTLASTLLSTVEDRIVPLTAKGVSSGSKVFGAAILSNSTLAPLTVATNNEPTQSP